MKKTTTSPFRFNYRLNLRNYVNTYYFWIVSVTCIFILGGCYYAFFCTPKYRATVILSSKIYGSLSGSAYAEEKQLSLENDQRAAPRELELIQSRLVLSKVVDKLLLDTTITPVGSSGKGRGLKIKRFDVSPDLNNQEIALFSVAPDTFSIKVKNKGALSEGSIGKDQSFEISSSETIRIAVDELPDEPTEYTLLKKPKDEIIEDILTNSVFEAPGIADKLVTNLIKISYTGMNPKQTTEIVNTIAEVAVDVSKNEERIQARNSLELMLREQKHLAMVLEEKTKRLSELKLQLGKPTLNESIDSQYTANQLESLVERIQDLESQRLAALTTRTELHPMVQEIEANLISFRQSLKDLKVEVSESLSLGHMVLNLQRDLMVYNKLYEEVTNDLEQFHARSEFPVGNLRIVEKAAIPDAPISYSKPVIILLSALVGLVCGYVVALAIE